MPAPRTQNRVSLLGPVFGWEVVRLVRKRRYFLLRMIYGLLLLFVVYVNWISSEFNFMGNPSVHLIERLANFSSSMFHAFTGMHYAAILVVTPALFATSLTIERERKTLDYLLASDLRSWEIIFDKTLARLTQLIGVLLVPIPVVAFVGLLGGIEYLQFAEVVLYSFVLILSLAGLSMLLSLYHTSTRAVLITVYILLAFVWFLPVVLVWIEIEFFYMPSTVYTAFGAPPPNESSWVDDLREVVIPYLQAAMTIWPMAPIAFMPSSQPFGPLIPSLEIAALIFVLFHLTLAAICFAWTAWRLRAVASRTKKIREPRKGKRSRRRFWPRPAVWSRYPLLWKELVASRTAGVNRSVGFLLVLIGVITTCALVGLYLSLEPKRDDYWWMAHNPYHFASNVMDILNFAAAIAFFLVAVRSASSIGEERDRDTWLTLISTPVTGTQIIWAKVIGALRPVGVVYLFFLVWIVLAVGIGEYAWTAPIEIGWTLFCHGLFIAAIGTRVSLSIRSAGQAIVLMLIFTALYCGIFHLMVAIIVEQVNPSVADGFMSIFLPWSQLAAAAGQIDANMSDEWRGPAYSIDFAELLLAKCVTAASGLLGVLAILFGHASITRIEPRSKRADRSKPVLERASN